MDDDIVQCKFSPLAFVTRNFIEKMKNSWNSIKSDQLRKFQDVDSPHS